MLEKIKGDCWFGEINEFKNLSVNDTEEGKLSKILCECQNGDFSNIVNLLDIASNTDNEEILEVSFKLFMCTASHKTIKNNMDKINKFLDTCSSDDDELLVASILSEHLPLSFSGEILSNNCNFIKYYRDLHDTEFVDGILLSIEFMLNANIYDGEDDIDEVLSNIPTTYIFAGEELDINALAVSLLEDDEDLEEDLCILLAIVTGITPPNFEGNISDLTKVVTKFLNTIIDKKFVKGKKYFYGHEVK